MSAVKEPEVVAGDEDPRGWPLDHDKELCVGPIRSPGGCMACDYRGLWVPHNKVEKEGTKNVSSRT